ncbi:MAG: hypothetical protein IH786_00095 [Proteobacteria bacterium]|nr:hypothetical protein [Pseudomonadota bacterium]
MRPAHEQQIRAWIQAKKGSGVDWIKIFATRSSRQGGTAVYSQEQLDWAIDDDPNMTLANLRSKSRRQHIRNGLDLLVVDYLQLMQGPAGRRSENRVQEVSEITRGLKAVAKELNVPVLALSQLSRQPEQRDDKRPQLADLRESGSIEQDADVVMFLYREEYYLARERPTQKANEPKEKFNERQADYDLRMDEARNKAEVIIAKQRHGPTGTVDLQFRGEFTRFSDLISDDHLPDDVPF